MIILRPFFYIGYAVLNTCGFACISIFSALDVIMERFLELFIVGLMAAIAYIVFYDPPELEPATEADFVLLKDTNQVCTLPAMDAKIEERRKMSRPVLQRDVTRVIKDCALSVKTDKASADQKAMMQKALGK